MGMKKLSKVSLKPTDSFEQAIEVLHKGGMRIAFILDQKSTLLGIITDGDIRHSLLKNKNMNIPVVEVMNSQPITASINDDKEDILRMMKEHNILHIPIIDSKGYLVDLETIHNKISKPKLDNAIVIMAGGYGKRLLPLTKDTPKPLLKVGAMPILESIIKRFINFGFHNFFISTYFKSEMIKDYFNEGSEWNVTIQYLEEEVPLGTGGALTLLPEDLSNLPLILMNGDLVTEVDFSSLLDNHNKSGTDATICVVEYDFQVPYGVIEIKEEDLKVKTITEKPTHKFFINAGIYVLNQNVIKNLDKTTYIDMPELLGKRVNLGNGVNIFPMYERWLDIGEIKEFNQANNLLNDDS